MVKMLRVKTLIPALLQGGRRRCFSDVPSNFPFAAAAAAAAAGGGGGATSSRLYSRTNNSVISSPEQIHDKRPWRNVHPSMASSKQSFPSNKAGVVENLKHLLTIPTVEDDEFEELGPSLQHSAELSSERMKEKCKDTKPPAFSLDNLDIQARRIHMQRSPRRNSHLSFVNEQLNPHSDNNINPLNQTDVSRTRAENQNYAVENKQSNKTISIDKDTKPSALSLDSEDIQANRIHIQQSPMRNSHLKFLDEQPNPQSWHNINPLNQTDVSITRTENQNCAVENIQSNRTISIDKIPPGTSLLNLKQAASFYGEILNASFETGPDRLTSCRVEFKSMESKERVLAAQRITVGNCQLPVRDLFFPEYITVRIGNISTESTEPAIHSMCATCGTVAGLSRTKEGAIDVVFKVKGNFEVQAVLRRLNIVNYRGCRWSAQLVPQLQQTSITDSSGTQWSVGLLINKEMETFRKQFQMQRIYLEDLENLHYGILHLRDQPADLNSQVSAARDRHRIIEEKLSEFL